MLDGARNALLGYLYQLLGTAAVRVREVPDATDAWAHLIARVDRGEVVSEEFGQDATIHPTATPKRGVTAIQFKHSGIAGGTIDRDELIDILVAFDRARREAASESVTIDHFALVTNRQLDARAEEIVAHRIHPTPHSSLKLITTRNGEPVATNVKRLAPHNDDPDRAAAAWHAVIRALDMVTGATFEGGLASLYLFAARYGVLDREREGRLDALVGALVRATAQGSPLKVTPKWLKEHLVGDPDAANLDFRSRLGPHITGICRERLGNRSKTQHRVPDSCYLERPVHEELHAAIERNPIVFVAGGGGCGKSMAVARYLQSRADCQFVWSESATRATEPSIVNAIATARLPQFGLGCADRSLRDIRARLEVANKNSAERPIWTIDLDGVDEAPEQRSELMHLIGVCWAHGNLAESPASLVVTCRSTSGTDTKEQLIREWLGIPEPDLALNVGFVPLGNFVTQQLLDAARLRRERPEQRIVQTLSAGAAVRPGHFEPVPGEILRTLQHPVVWGNYAALSEAERAGVLDEKPAHLELLAKRLYDRFLGRCRMRRRWKDERLLERALPAVARAVAGPPPYSAESWDRACGSHLGPAEAKDLYHESLSYGLVERESGRGWRWGHPILTDYLAALGGGNAGE